MEIESQSRKQTHAEHMGHTWHIWCLCSVSGKSVLVNGSVSLSLVFPSPGEVGHSRAHVPYLWLWNPKSNERRKYFWNLKPNLSWTHLAMKLLKWCVTFIFCLNIHILHYRNINLFDNGVLSRSCWKGVIIYGICTHFLPKIWQILNSKTYWSSRVPLLWHEIS